MAARNTRPEQKPCKDCPPGKASPAPVIQVITPEEFSIQQGEKLWNHVLTGTETCVSMIEQYEAMGLPYRLDDRLGKLILRLLDVVGPKITDEDVGGKVVEAGLTISDEMIIPDTHRERMEEISIHQQIAETEVDEPETE